MRMEDVEEKLREHGIQPSTQRVAVGRVVLVTDAHPSADQVWARVKEDLPTVSRATVYNTLNLFVEKGLLRQLAISEGRVVFDPNMQPHHHLIDQSNGEIHDVPWEAVDIRGTPQVEGFSVQEFQVVIRGTRKH
jgi:Fur family iron response transcriptional regulator